MENIKGTKFVGLIHRDSISITTYRVEDEAAVKKELEKDFIKQEDCMIYFSKTEEVYNKLLELRNYRKTTKRTTKKLSEKEDYESVVSNGELHIQSQNDSSFFVVCPYDYKNAFKSRFKAKWNGATKTWVVSKNTTTEEELKDYIYRKNSKISKGTAKKNSTNASKSYSASYVSEREAFEDYCADNQLDYTMGTSQEKDSLREFRSKYSN